MKSIPRKLIVWLAVVLFLSFSNCAQALIACSVSSTGFANGYVPTNLTTNITAATFAVTCSRDNAGGPANATVQYNMSVNNGIYAVGTQNRAALGASFLNYSLATDAACAIQWSGATTIPATVISFLLAKNTVVTNTYNFYGCIPPGQLALPPEGIYTDTVTMVFTPGKATGASSFTGGTFPVRIVAPASCNITTPPTNISFAYTAFSAAAVLANATFGMTCTTSLAYSMALDMTVDVVTGLNYSLALNTVATGGASPLASVGTGIAQTFFINGTMAAGQAGTCAAPSCVGSQVRTLTITY